MNIQRSILTVALLLGAVTCFPIPIHAATAYELERDGRKALHELYEKNPKAVMIANQASGALIFPTIVKAGFIFGAQGGDGVLFSGGRVIGYYNTSAISYGLQAGVQKYGYVLFFMDHAAMTYLERSEGWEIGTGPSIVIVDKGAAGSMTSTTLKDDIYAFVFNQKGLMAGIGLQGSKITKYTPNE